MVTEDQHLESEKTPPPSLVRASVPHAPPSTTMTGRVQRAVVRADEASWRAAWRNGYAWLLATPEGERSVILHRSRAGGVISVRLGDAFAGVLVSDFSAGYSVRWSSPARSAVAPARPPLRTPV